MLTVCNWLSWLRLLRLHFMELRLRWILDITEELVFANLLAARWQRIEVRKEVVGLPDLRLIRGSTNSWLRYLLWLKDSKCLAACGKRISGVLRGCLGGSERVTSKWLRGSSRRLGKGR